MHGQCECPHRKNDHGGYIMKPGKTLSFSTGSLLLTTMLSTTAFAAECPPATVADPMGLSGAFPQQLEIEELGCDLILCRKSGHW